MWIMTSAEVVKVSPCEARGEQCGVWRQFCSFSFPVTGFFQGFTSALGPEIEVLSTDIA